MTLHVYNCETSTIRSEMVRRTKADGAFYGLRLHMNTDQTITLWGTSPEQLMQVVQSLVHTVANTQPSELPTVPGQMST